MVTKKVVAKGAKQSGVKPTVFVIEDIPLARDVMVTQFRRNGFDAEGFTGAEPQLIETIVKRANAVLLDKNLLPGEDGLAGSHESRSGLTIAREVRERAPWVMIALHTGETDEPPQHLAPHDAFILKEPYKDPGETISRIIDIFRCQLAGKFPVLKDLPADGKKLH